jgi:hypothetical protein
VRRRLRPPDESHGLAAANYRMGEYLAEQGHGEDARTYLEEAKRLQPESWAFRRQTWALEDPAKAGGPEFWAAVDALGDRPYYESVEMPGMDRPPSP